MNWKTELFKIRSKSKPCAFFGFYKINSEVLNYIETLHLNHNIELYNLVLGNSITNLNFPVLVLIKCCTAKWAQSNLNTETLLLRNIPVSITIMR
jgi:hypothetical protein